MKRGILVVALLGMSSVASALPIWTADLLPLSGDLTAAAGDRVGWGYRIANADPTLWLVTLGLDADTFEHGTPNSLFLFPTLSPGQVVDLPYTGTSGLYEFTWDANAPLGFVNLGQFLVTAEWFTGDPANGGVFSQAAGVMNLPYSVTAVLPSEPAPVPEPGVLFLVLAPAAILVGRRWMSRCPPVGPCSRLNRRPE